ncbi:MAG: glutamate-5-semialdehyde dehydrogenase, partial [Nitrospinota bacterium]
MIQSQVQTIGRQARLCGRKLSNLSTIMKNSALEKMAENLEKSEAFLIRENTLDVENGRKNGLSKAMLDRLTLDRKRISEMAGGIREIILLPDPVGEVSRMVRRPNGLQIGRLRTPIGVIGIIYESRPNVTADVSALCIKSGNAVILKGGSEAINSNRAIVKILSEAAKEAGLPDFAVQFIDSTSREAVNEMLTLDIYIDLIIPRGGHSLIRSVMENSTIPVIKHDKGLCHVFIDKYADMEKGVRVAVNAKTHRTGVCNAMETLLVHKEISATFLPMVISKLQETGVQLRGCEETRKVSGDMKPATDEDWDTEYLDSILSIKVVADVDDAISHITEHGSMLAESIVSEKYTNTWKFLQEVDTTAIYI